MKKLMQIVVLTLTILALTACQEEKKSMTNEEYRNLYTYRNTQSSFAGTGDPDVFYNESDKMYYLTGTKDGSSFTIQSSSDLNEWSNAKTILSADQVTWGLHDPSQQAYGLWGAEIHKRGDLYYLYYSIWKNEDGKPGNIAIGVATSKTVDGLYQPASKPVIDFGFATIDNHLFRDTDGKEYFLFVRDCSENVVGDYNESHVYIAEMNDDYCSIKEKSIDECTLLIRPEQSWELKSGSYRWNEGCWMQKIGDLYYLFYSANYFGDVSEGNSLYAIGYATSNSIKGPFVKYKNNPIIESYGSEVRGPGNNSIFFSPDGKEMFTAYHMMDEGRYVAIDRMGIRKDGSIFISGPNLADQPIPSGTKEGHTLLSDKAIITCSSTKNGLSPELINDGEIVVVPKYSDYIWQSDENEKLEEQYVLLNFEKEVEVNSIYLWNSVMAKYITSEVNIEFSDGSIIENVKLSDFYGGAAIVNLDGKKTKTIKISLAKSGFNQKAFALSEVKVYGN